jgi:hypothetical protein
MVAKMKPLWAALSLEKATGYLYDGGFHVLSRQCVDRPKITALDDTASCSRTRFKKSHFKTTAHVFAKAPWTS